MSVPTRLATAFWVVLVAARLAAAQAEGLPLRYHWQAGQRWERSGTATMVLHWPAPGKQIPHATVTRTSLEELRVESVAADGMAALSVTVRELRRELLVDGRRLEVHSTAPGEAPAGRDPYLRHLLAHGIRFTIDGRGRVGSVLHAPYHARRMVAGGPAIEPSGRAASACLLAMQHDYDADWIAAQFVSYPGEPSDAQWRWSVVYLDPLGGPTLLPGWPGRMVAEVIDGGEQLRIAARVVRPGLAFGPPMRVAQRQDPETGALHTIDRATGMPLFSTVWMSGSYGLSTVAAEQGPLVHWSANARYLVTPITAPGA